MKKLINFVTGDAEWADILPTRAFKAYLAVGAVVLIGGLSMLQHHGWQPIIMMGVVVGVVVWRFKNKDRS